jgi:lipopolysaccharide transport system ATP-binding protein
LVVFIISGGWNRPLRTSSDIVVDCAGLGKRYRIGERQRYKTLRETLAQASSRLFRRPAGDEERYIWALDDVSFQTAKGSVLGIIGRNGAGKSTLLKILSRITKPTRGRATIRGRVGSLLEVGTGFHSELTGRENIFLNGAILGMKRAEIVRRFDEIVAFAEIGDFLDTPVKRYSSGMYMRLAFAVAAHLDPDILVVDEVLAVGDAVFQKKCLGKMGEVSQHGRTVLFISHNMLAVQAMCDDAIWLDQGRVREIGPVREVVHGYTRDAQSTLVERTWPEDGAPGDTNLKLQRVAVQSDDRSGRITVRTAVRLNFDYAIATPGLNLNLNFYLYNEEGILIFNSDTRLADMPAGRFRSVCHIPGDLLNAGTHSVAVTVVRDEAHVLLEASDVVVFDVDDSTHGRGSWYDRWPGVVRPILKWDTTPADEEVFSLPMSGSGRRS